MNLKLILISFLFCSKVFALEQNSYIGQIQVEKFENEQNKTIKYDVISLKNPQNIYIPDEDLNLKNIKKIQLNYMDRKFKIVYKKPAKIICKDLYSADSIYHYTDVICIVDKILYK
ncbi:hypothetical protein [Acinetobacter sp. ANC 4169]|uniref:hypothetical protein n=1 Tax=Acinetobacter sp. ANC 4169 TaxID=1977879 RepID=UPI001D0CF550|nr:hypothetical protein [Acinetobacter sp. ANC 4169]